MSALSSIASSGMQAAQMRLSASAHNVANINTPNARRVAVVQEAAPNNAGVRASMALEGNNPTSLATEAVAQMSATYAFAANLLSVQTENRMMGRLLDVRA